MPTFSSYLSDEIASVKRDTTIAAYGVGDMVLQTDEIFLGRAKARYEEYEKLRRDSHCQSVLSKREMAVIAREWQVDPGGTSRADKKAAELVKAHLENLGSRADSDEVSATGLDLMCLNLLDAILKGFSVGEVLWAKDGNEIYPTHVKVRNQQRFQFAINQKERYELRMRTLDKVDGEALTKNYPRKFIVHTFGAKDGNPYGSALGSTLWFPVFFKKQDIKFWLSFCEKYATPTTIGRQQSGATPEQKRVLMEALNAIASDAGIIVPDGTEISFLEASRSGSIDCYEKLASYMDTEMSKTVLGETLSTEMGGTGSYAASQTHDGVRKELAKADADLLSDTLNRTLVRWITELNVPGAKPPKLWRNFKEMEDLNARVQRDKVLFDMGWSLKAEAIAEIYGDYYEQPAPQNTNDQFLASSGATQDTSTQAEAPSEEQPVDETADMGEPLDYDAIIDRVVKWNGLQIGVEYGVNAVRFPGARYARKLRSGYGHIRGYFDKGRSLDCYIYPGLLKNPPEGSDRLFQITQLLPDGQFDQYKWMVGFDSFASARLAYLTEMPQSKFGGIVEITPTDLERYRKVESFAEQEQEDDAADIYSRQLSKQASPIVADWLKQVRQLVQSADSFEEVRDRLFDLYPQMDSQSFAEVLGQAMVATEAAGRYEVLHEAGEL